MAKIGVILFIPLWLSLSCASLNDETKLANVDLSNSEQAPEWQKQTSAGGSGLSKYSFANQEFAAEWLTCRKEGLKEATLVMHRDQAGYDSKTFCNGWIAQAFLSANYNVIAVNRPGFGQSSGPLDFSGPQSVAAIQAGLSAATAGTVGIGEVVGAWGYSSGTIAAAFVAKKIGTLKWLVLGGGIYDADIVNKQSADPIIKFDLARVTAQNPDQAVEQRSIAWDTAGLPKRIFIYHGSKDLAVPHEQAKIFRDSLAVAEINVSYELLNEMTHTISWPKHRQIIETVLASLKQ